MACFLVRGACHQLAFILPKITKHTLSVAEDGNSFSRCDTRLVLLRQAQDLVVGTKREISRRERFDTNTGEVSRH